VNAAKKVTNTFHRLHNNNIRVDFLPRTKTKKTKKIIALSICFEEPIFKKIFGTRITVYIGTIEAGIDKIFMQ